MQSDPTYAIGIETVAALAPGQQGQPLVALEPTEFKAAMVEAQGAVAQADARMRQMRELTLPAAQEALKQARATLVNAEAAFLGRIRFPEQASDYPRS